ncbi:Metallo-beta-lactamase superfamily protein [Nocardioides sp. YR527]|uniref:MBL fold metallo-hydrolase n=1 Tax=Nocardioides sp. YR527 TaxID=1881028 RepID=UPI00087F862C|nr:MBL fold metallo-hydrolase [Nocardioides sp. YR527]SDL02595.1 Metallo-beta-lactamase superfamily protein [Nocardioides sp. YR527]
MKVHHLNCGTMHPVATPGSLVCHVLLVETENGLVLVDSGFGTQDAADPKGRFGEARFLIRPTFDVSESALEQVTRLGFDPQDVRHVVLTHFDADHTGGLADFPWAQVHLTAAENFAALHPQGAVERGRYLPSQRAHGPVIVEHTPDEGESWRGFAGAKELTEISAGLVLINLPGHSRGHAAVAVAAGDHWVLHVGDSFYHHGQIDGSGHAPRTLTLMERLIAHDRKKVRANHERLTELWAASSPDLVLVNAHDPSLLHRAAARATPA